ncbi:MauE/DoxX family redox-associated membrane protein [Flavobacterium selenitireducens]|uniref:MauE/DoxX family redox-associated membrane protein n=1 Tax=Flavobacterium selenitireducens TaxID=2722704 RepID=UPI0038CC1509
MLKRERLTRLFTDLVCSLYTLLFVYAALSKLLDYKTFMLQLGQSPMLSAFANWISWLVPSLEIVIALLLFIPRFKLTALFAAYILMSMFTAYIYILLNYSSFVPCSCGGILDSLTWSQHMAFNLAFALLAVIAILAYPYHNSMKLRNYAASI